MVSTDPGPWIGALLIFGFFTILIKDNIWFQICQMTIVGAGVAHALVWAIDRTKSYVIVPLQGPNPDYLLVVFSLVGLLSLFRLSKQYGWLGRYFTGFSMGIGLGLTAGSNINAMIKSQIASTIGGLATTNTFEFFNAVIVLLNVIFIGIYFIFTIKPEALSGSVGWAQRLGRLLLMVTMGSSAPPYIAGCIGYTMAPLVMIVYDFLML
jgi:hypothetical protein